jgi:hypothetical protein
MRTTPALDARIVISVAVLLLSIICPALGAEISPVTVKIDSIAAPSDTQIQQALDRLPPAGGTLVLDPGIYEIHHPLLLLRNGLTLRGSGNLTVLHLVDRANCPGLILGSLKSNPSQSIHDLHVSDLAIDGNRHQQLMEQWVDRSNTSGIENNGLMIQGVSNSTVERVVAAHCRSGGLVTANGTRNLTVSEFTAFDSEFDGLACYKTENSVFTKLNLHDNLSGAGISLDLNFNHNLISDSTLDGNDLGIFMRDSVGNQFLNLSINHSRHYGVFMAQWAQSAAKGWAYVPKTECTDNQFDGLKIRNCGTEAFCIHDPGCVRNQIQDGVFTGNRNNDLALLSAPATHRPVLLATKNQ